MLLAKPTTKLYCNLLAIEKGLDPIGQAHDFEDSLILETPLPWKNSLYSEAGALPQEMIDLLALWLERYRAGQGYPHRPLMVAPDAEYSTPGYRRVMFYTRPKGAFAEYQKVEYNVPDAELGALLWALYEARDNLPRFEAYRVPEHDSTRDILVCTHGTIDAACAKFGFPLFRYMREHHAGEHLRVWRVSHFGGHVFAPTLMDMPIGHYWAYVEEAQADQIVRRDGNPRDLYGHYRGWAGVEDGFLQVLERELWMDYGWRWFSLDKTGRILAKQPLTDGREAADVEITVTLPDSAVATYTARVEVRNHINTIHTTGNTAEYPYPQYSLSEVVRTA